MLSKRIENIKQAIAIVDSKKERLLHRRQQLEAQLAKLERRLASLSDHDRKLQGVVERAPLEGGSATSTTGDNHAASGVLHSDPMDLGGLKVTDVHVLLESVLRNWPYSKNQVHQDLATLEVVNRADLLLQSKEAEWAAKLNELLEEADYMGFNVRWLKGYFKRE